MGARVGFSVKLDIDRNTAIRAVHRLLMERRIVKSAGMGRQPNRYLLTEQVVICAPGNVPTRVVLTEQKQQALDEQWTRNPTAEEQAGAGL